MKLRTFSHGFGRRILLPALTVTLLIGTCSRLPGEEPRSAYVLNLSSSHEPEGETWLDDAPNLAVEGDQVHLCWSSIRSDYQAVRILYRRSDDNGRTFAEPVVMAEAGNHNDIGFFLHGKHLAVSEGRVHAAWIQQGTLQYARSSDGGASFEPARALATGQSCTSLIIQAKGAGVAIATADAGWSIGQGNPRSIACYYSTDAGQQFSRSEADRTEEVGWGFDLRDMILGETRVHVLYHSWNRYNFEGRIYLASSHDGGVTFPHRHALNTASDNEAVYVTVSQDYNYSPKLAVSGNRLIALWYNNDVYSYSGPNGYSLRAVSSTDAGINLSAHTVASYAPSFANAYMGFETVAALGDEAWILFKDRDTSHMRLSRWSDGFSTDHLLDPTGSDWGWWPQLVIDPSDPTGHTVHLLPGWNFHFLTRDNGASFTGFLNLGLESFQSCVRPRLAVAGNHLYWAAIGNLFYGEDPDLFFRSVPLPFGTEPGPLSSSRFLRLNDTDPALFDNLQIRKDNDLALSTAFTLACWVRPQADSFMRFFLNRRYLGEGSIELGRWSAGGPLFARLVTADMGDTYYGMWLGGGSLPVGEWAHLALTYEASVTGGPNVHLYLNGTVVSSGTATGAVLQDPLPYWIGEHQNTASQHSFDLDDLAIWDRALSASEITGLMAGAPLPASLGLRTLLTFDGASLIDQNWPPQQVIPMFQATLVPGNAPYVPGGLWSGLVAANAEGDKKAGIGWINDRSYPYVWHYSIPGYLYVLHDFSTLNRLYLYDYSSRSWLWSSEYWGGWYYAYATGLYGRW